MERDSLDKGVDQDALEAFAVRGRLCAEIKGEAHEAQRRLSWLLVEEQIQANDEDVLRLKAAYTRLAINREFAFRRLREREDGEALLRVLRKDSQRTYRAFVRMLHAFVELFELGPVRSDFELQPTKKSDRWRDSIPPVLVEMGEEQRWTDHGLALPPDFTMGIR